MNLIEELEGIFEVENNIILDINFVGSEEDAMKVAKQNGIKFKGSKMSGPKDMVMKFLTSDQKVFNIDDLKKEQPNLFKG